jgi:hypothetical protein
MKDNRTPQKPVRSSWRNFTSAARGTWYSDEAHRLLSQQFTPLILPRAQHRALQNKRLGITFFLFLMTTDLKFHSRNPLSS